MNRPPLFSDMPGVDDCAEYVACRDHRMTKAGTRRALSRTWNALGSVLPGKPEDFVFEFRRDFHARAWELFVLAYLARSGATLAPSPAHGPDFHATLPGLGSFWVECVVPRHGTGDDAVWKPPPGHTGGALGSPERVALRYANALSDKIKKVTSYRARGIVKPKEAVLIALNQGGLDHADLHDTEVPLVVRVLFGVGEPVLLINVDTGERRVEVPPMPTVRKRSGNDVGTALFLDATAGPVAGVLFAPVSVWNLFGRRRPRLYLAHNPGAVLRFPVGALPVRGECWVSGDTLAHAGKMSSYAALSIRRRWPVT